MTSVSVDAKTIGSMLYMCSYNNVSLSVLLDERDGRISMETVVVLLSTSLISSSAKSERAKFIITTIAGLITKREEEMCIGCAALC